jgi:hypothetical protein
MDGRERDFRDAIMEACAPFDVRVDFDRGSKHPYAKIALPCGKTLKSYYPGSTSDFRSVLNNKSQVRRMLKKNEAPLKPASDRRQTAFSQEYPKNPERLNQTAVGTLGEIIRESFKSFERINETLKKPNPEPELPFMQPETKLIRNGKDVPDVKPINITKPDEPKFAKLTKDETIQLTRLLSKNSDVENDIVTFSEGWDDSRLHKILAAVPGRDKLSVKTITDFRREHFGLTQEEIKERARVNRPEAYATKGIKAELASFDKRIAKLEAIVEKLAKDLGV